MNENHWIESLSVPLPEDVMKHKWNGNFAAAERLIERRLREGCPEAMRRRLLLEQKILKRLPGNYPLDWDGALMRLQEAVEGFRPEELTELMDSDYADWIYVEGKPHFRDNLAENLFKTRADYAARRRKKPEGESAENRFLQEALRQMQADGGMERTLRLRSRLRLCEEAGAEAGETVRVWLPLPGVGAQVKAVRILDDGVKGMPAGSVKRVRIAPGSAPSSGKRPGSRGWNSRLSTNTMWRRAMWICGGIRGPKRTRAFRPGVPATPAWTRQKKTICPNSRRISCFRRCCAR